MNKLLDERQLKARAINILVRYGTAVIDRDALTPMREEIDAAFAELKELIESQKCAHAAAIIGEDEHIDSSLDQDWFLIETSLQMGGVKPFHLKQARNAFRASQREMNHVPSR